VYVALGGVDSMIRERPDSPRVAGPACSQSVHGELARWPVTKSTLFGFRRAQASLSPLALALELAHPGLGRRPQGVGARFVEVEPSACIPRLHSQILQARIVWHEYRG